MIPDPAWAEEVPGLAKYYFGEAEANAALNVLRANVCVWMANLVNPDRSWEASDEWPPSSRLQAAVEALRCFLPQDAPTASAPTT
jgi:hypothetical protein